MNTFDPLTQRRRQSEGKKILDDALMMGARDGRFLHDAGMVLLSMSTRAGMAANAVDALSLSRTTLGAEFDTLADDRKADWFAGMGKGLAELGLSELARQHFTQAAALAPQTHSGEMAREWLKANYGG